MLCFNLLSLDKTCSCGYLISLTNSSCTNVHQEMLISVYISAELFIHLNPPPRVHRRATRHAGGRVLRGGCARRQHQGRDMLLRRGPHQVQPQVTGRRVRAPCGARPDGTD